MMLPHDPGILLSVVNTKLRDEFASLTELCDALDVPEEELCEKLADYRYDPDQNRFI